MFFALLLSNALPAFVPAVRGQPSVRAGDKVRVDAPGRGFSGAVGVLQDIDDETLVIAFADPKGEVTLRTDEINRLEVSFFQGSHGGRGAMVGFLVGAGGGLAVGLTERDSECESNLLFCVRVPKEEKMVWDVLIGTSIGAGLGFLVGRELKTDRWMPASIRENRVSLFPIALGGRPGFSASITF
jgi:hypothetical protein